MVKATAAVTDHAHRKTKLKKIDDLKEESMSHQYRPEQVVVRWVMLTVVVCITFSLTAPPAAADSAPRAYVANFSANSVSVINTGTNQVVGSPITVGDSPLFLALTPNSRFLYVVNVFAPSVSVINTTTNIVVATVPLGTAGVSLANGVAITPDGRFAYVATQTPDGVSVMNTATNTVVQTITAGFPAGARAVVSCL